MSLRYIWFDLGLTLAKPNHANLYQEALQKIGYDVEIERIEMAYHLANKYFMREHPGVLGKKEGKEGYLKELLKYLDLEVCLEEFTEQMRTMAKPSKWTAYPFTERVLRQLHERGIQTGLISNWDLGCRDVLKEMGLYELLNPIVVSSEVGIEKPSKAIFELALEKSGCQPEECLYVGDNYYDDVIGASQVGIQTILINPSGRIGIEELDYPYVITSIEEIDTYIMTHESRKKLATDGKV